MKIVILGSVALPVPPPMQGGTERMAWFQARGLADLGHEVTLVAASGSKKSDKYKLVEIGGGDTVSGSANALNSKFEIRNSKQIQNPKSKIQNLSEVTEGSRKMRKEAVYWAEVIGWLYDNQDSFDVILNNMRGAEAVFLPVAKQLGKPIVNVMHLPIFDKLAGLFDKYKTSVVTISDAQRKEFPDLNYIQTVYNGIEIDRFNLVEAPGDEYLLMMGSFAPHKNQAGGIEVAKKLGMKIIMAGKIGNKEYYKKEIAPHVDDERVVKIGEISFEEKVKLLGNARILLFPILWEEPFGLVMIEAMACGTPVVAYSRGAIPEVVKDGVTGYIIEDDGRNFIFQDARKPLSPSAGGFGKTSKHIVYSNNKKEENNWIIKKTGAEGLVEAVEKIGEIDRKACRKHVEDNFTDKKMVESLDVVLKRVL
ncbi:glycosyltransferase family 4 protein [Patescibacteria group bacterium]